MSARMLLAAGLLLCACKTTGKTSEGSAAPSGSVSASATAPAHVDDTAPRSGSDALQELAMPGGEGGIGFDDLVFAPALRRVLVAAGATGKLDLVDPDTLAVTSIAGLSAAQGTFRGGHGDGTTSADEGRGLLFAIDRTSSRLHVIDPAARAIVASAPLGGSPDYVRFVGPTSEVWVTEPDAERIEVFALPATGKPTPRSIGVIPLADGPESLVVDPSRKRAFTHTWKGGTVAIDLVTRVVGPVWPNGCRGSRGIALDAKRGFLFAGCAEGMATVLDVDHGGKRLGSVTAGDGIDVIAYAPSRGHLYLPGASSATMAIASVEDDGALRVLATVPTAAGAHCVAADDRGNAWVCDPKHGRLLRVKDTFGPPRHGDDARAP